MMWSTFFSFLVLSASHCELESSDSGEVTLNLGGQSMEIEAISPYARLLKCEPINQMPGYFVVNIDLGSAGTSMQFSQTDVMVLESTPNGLKKRYQEVLKQSAKNSEGQETLAVNRSYNLKVEGDQILLHFEDEESPTRINLEE